MVVVEDDTAVRRSLQLLLLSRGLNVRAHGSARQALADPHSRSAACLVADLVLPEADGVALLGELRGSGWDGPAILISGHLTPDRSAAAVKAGYIKVIPKPFAENVVADAVFKALNGAAPR